MKYLKKLQSKSKPIVLRVKKQYKKILKRVKPYKKKLNQFFTKKIKPLIVPVANFLEKYIFHHSTTEKISIYTENPVSSSRILLYSILISSSLLLVWAGTTEIDERAIAQGQVIPSLKTQNIQSLDGGILEEIYVHEGDIVQKDQKIVKIDDTIFASSFEENKNTYYSNLARITRLDAEANDFDIIEFAEEINIDS